MITPATYLDSGTVINRCSISREKRSQEIKNSDLMLHCTSLMERALRHWSGMIRGNVYAFNRWEILITIQRRKPKHFYGGLRPSAVKQRPNLIFEPYVVATIPRVRAHLKFVQSRPMRKAVRVTCVLGAPSLSPTRNSWTPLTLHGATHRILVMVMSSGPTTDESDFSDVPDQRYIDCHQVSCLCTSHYYFSSGESRPRMYFPSRCNRDPR